MRSNGFKHMSKIVKCDICGGTYNQSYLRSHKRLSHGPRKISLPLKTEPETLQVMLSLYETLSDDGKSKVRDLLLVSKQSKH